MQNIFDKSKKYDMIRNILQNLHTTNIHIHQIQPLLNQ